MTFASNMTDISLTGAGSSGVKGADDAEVDETAETPACLKTACMTEKGSPQSPSSQVDAMPPKAASQGEVLLCIELLFAQLDAWKSNLLFLRASS